MTDKLRILFLGPAGAGKGTQAAKIADKLNIPHLSTGDIIRAEIKSGSELGNKVKAIVEAGQLVSDEIVNEIVKAKVLTLDKYILDGYPRTLGQAQAYAEYSDFDFVFDLEAEREELVKRLSGRRMCTKTKDPNCTGVFHLEYNTPQESDICDLCGSELYQRKDDSAESINKRLDGYMDETGIPLGEFYATKITKVNAMQNPDQVFADLMGQLDTSRV